MPETRPTPAKKNASPSPAKAAGAPKAKKTQKKKKLRTDRILILVLAACVLVGLCGWGIYALTRTFSGQDQETEQQLPAVSAEEIEAIQKPEAISQETFDALKTQALSDPESLPSRHAANLLGHIEEYDEDILAFYLRDDDRYEFVSQWPDRENLQTPVASLEESLETVPALLQWDLRWGYQPYGDSMIYAAGCAPTTMSMVASYLNQDETLTPRKIADWADSSGQYSPGQGTLYTFFTDAAAEYGLNVESIPVDSASIEDAAAQGKIMIFHLLPGTFTTFGHFVVVPGVENGRLKINDPNSIERSSHLWDYSQVLSETAAIWAYSKAE